MRAFRSSDPLGAATARVQRETPTTGNAPLFRSLIERLAEDQRWVVLDLGAARPQIIALLNRRRNVFKVGAACTKMGRLRGRVNS